MTPRSWTGWARTLSLNDWLVIGYLATLNLAIALAEHRGPAQVQAQREMLLLLLLFVAGVVLGVRLGLLRGRFSAPLAYRLCHYGGIQLTYFSMRGFLPIVNPNSLDRELHQIDLDYFGLEPALAMQPWINAATTEWFSFFYYGYFFVLGLYVLPILLCCRDGRLLSEFGLGITLVLTLGQFTYLLVPGYGPANGLPELFDTQLPPGVWWNSVREIVASAGAQKDIFPSIHTAAPMFALLFSFRNRAHLPYRYVWPVLAIFVCNIIVATMFLRWHWLVDIVAGLLLALVAHPLSVAGTAWERRHRREHRLQPAWPPWPGRAG